MVSFASRLGLAALVATAWLGAARPLPAQEFRDPPAEPQPMPRGVEVQARGPVHEAFASMTGEPVPTNVIRKKPPQPLDEMPPDEKPAGDVVWISGYWAFDDDRNDFIWVSGTWRKTPPNKHWVGGYWREADEGFQWVGGFWTPNQKQNEEHEVVYYAEPPAPPNEEPPPRPNVEDCFWVPGVWVWRDGRYMRKPGYWAHVQPGYVWVAAHYRWSPSGYVFIPGYWDYAVSRRGVLYAPVYVDRSVVRVGFVYQPAYAVRDTVVLDSLFVRPCYCHYYFGDYYEVAYRDRYGFVCCYDVEYRRRNYDAIIVYERWDHRREPAWERDRLQVVIDIRAGRREPPPRTLVQQNVVVQQNITNVTVINNVKVNNNTVLMAPSQLAQTKGTQTVRVDPQTQQLAKQQAQAIQQVSAQRSRNEVSPPPAANSGPKVASLNVPQAQPVKPDMTPPKMPAPPSGGPGSGGTKSFGGNSTPGGIGKPVGDTTRTAPPGQQNTRTPGGPGSTISGPGSGPGQGGAGKPPVPAGGPRPGPGPTGPKPPAKPQPQPSGKPSKPDPNHP